MSPVLYLCLSLLFSLSGILEFLKELVFIKGFSQFYVCKWSLKQQQRITRMLSLYVKWYSSASDTNKINSFARNNDLQLLSKKRQQFLLFKM